MVDKAVKKIRPQDDELSRIQDNLADAVQQLLNQANATPGQQAVFSPLLQQLRGPGTAYSVKTQALHVNGRSDGPWLPSQPTVQFGDAAGIAPNGVPTPQRDSYFLNFGYGVFVGGATQNDVVVIIPQKPGPVIRSTNVGNGQSNWTVDDAGNLFARAQVSGGSVYSASSVQAATTVSAGTTVSGANVVSGAGFANMIDFGGAWNGALAANTGMQTARFMQNQQTLGGTAVVPRRVKMPRSGSIVGYSYSQTGTNNGVQFLQVQKNGANLNVFNVGQGPGEYWASIPKGQYPFAAGDTLIVLVSSNVANNMQVQVQLLVEMSA